MNQEEPITDDKTPKWFWVVSGILLLWNVMGLLAFAANMTLSNNEDAIQQSGLNEEQIELIKSTPTWVSIAFAVAVIFGFVGCVVLLMRKSLALPLLVISLLGVLAQSTYVFFLSNSVEVMGIGLSPIVISIAIALIPFAMYCSRQDWWR